MSGNGGLSIRDRLGIVKDRQATKWQQKPESMRRAGQERQTGRESRRRRDLHAGSQHFFAGPSAAVDLARSLLAARATG